MFSKSSFGPSNKTFGYSSRNMDSSIEHQSKSLNQPTTSTNSFERNNNQPIFNSNNVFNNPNNSVHGHQSNMDTSLSTGMGENLKEQVGTTIKFSVSKSSESMFKGGLNQILNIAFQSISCMKEYEDKSFEELRIEDYQVNRKGSQQEFFGNNNTTPTSNSINFAQKDENSIFIQSVTDVKQTYSLFNKKSFASSFNSSQTNTLFGSNTANNVPFPTQPSTSIGSHPTTSSFMNQSSSLFDKTTTLNSTFSPNINPLGIFGQTITPNINSATTDNQSIFTNNAAVSPFFGNQNKSNSVGGGRYPIEDENTMLNVTQVNSPETTVAPQPGTSNQSQEIDEQSITSLLKVLYQTSKLFDNITTSDKNFKERPRPTNPRELNTVSKTLKKKPTPAAKMKSAQGYGRNEPIFTGLEHNNEELVLNTRVSNNPKRLVVRSNPSNNHLNVRDSSSTDLSNSEHIAEETPYDELQALQKKVSNDYNLKSISNSFENITISGINAGTSTSSYKVFHPPAGIILTRSEYYTIPSMDEIINYVEKDGSCLVKGFTIGRYRYGSVCFPDTFDVSNLNIDELVHFSNKEISIYPDDTKKPPLGHGLNRRAQVTLENVYPWNKKTKSLITDVKTLIELDYSTRLRKLCEEQETHFIDYRPETGSWIFKVDHF